MGLHTIHRQAVVVTRSELARILTAHFGQKIPTDQTPTFHYADGKKPPNVEKVDDWYTACERVQHVRIGWDVVVPEPKAIKKTVPKKKARRKAR